MFFIGCGISGDDDSLSSGFHRYLTGEPMKRLLTLLIVCTSASFSSLAQQRYSHNLFCFRLVLSDTLNSKLKWEVLLQRRTQNNYDGDPNLFNSPQFKNYWLWFHYSLNNNVTVSVSPFGYVESHVLNNKPSDADLPPVKEFRFSARVEHETNGKHFNYSNRYSLEFRNRDLLHNDDYRHNLRIRYMAKIDKPVKGILSDTKPVVFTVSDEVFLQFGEAVRNNPNVFDQNRLSLGATYEIYSHVKLNIAYIYAFQARNSGKEFDNINMYWIALIFDNVISQFTHR